MNKESVVTLRFTTDLKRRLAVIAEKDERSVSATIRRVVRGYVEEREAEVRSNVSKV